MFKPTVASNIKNRSIFPDSVSECVQEGTDVEAYDTFARLPVDKGEDDEKSVSLFSTDDEGNLSEEEDYVDNHSDKDEDYIDLSNSMNILEETFHHKDVSVPDDASKEVSIPAGTFHPKDICEMVNKNLYVHAICKDKKIFEIKHQERYNLAIERSVSTTLQQLQNIRIAYGFKDDPPEKDTYAYSRVGNHWSIGIDKTLLEYWIRQISVQSVFDLGCKNPDLPCYCPYQSRFERFLDEITILSFIKPDYGLCQNNKKANGFDTAGMCNHFRTGKNGKRWYHTLVDTYVCEMYDLHTKPKGRKRKRALKKTLPIHTYSVQR